MSANEFDLNVVGILSPGYGHASGIRSKKYPEGTINLQRPHFFKHGLDISDCFAGTLNVSIAPRSFRMKTAEFLLHEIIWKEGRRAENFMIARCKVKRGIDWLPSFVYYPDPSTKDNSIDDPQQIQILAPKIEGIKYGDKIELLLRSKEIEIL